MGGRAAVAAGESATSPGWTGTDKAVRVERPLPLVVDLDRGLSPAFVSEAAICALRQGPAGALGLLSGALSAHRSFDDVIAAIGAFEPAPGLFDARMLAAVARAQAEGREILLLTSAFPALARRLCATRAWAGDVIVAAQGDDIAELSRLAAVRTRCPAGFIAFSGADDTAPWLRAAVGGADPTEPASGDAAAPIRSPLRVWVKAARLHQWTKNLLVFLPLVLAGRALDPAAWLMAAVGFLSFGLVASATYLLNDLHDLDHDRVHRSKRHRPLASGALPIPAAFLGIVLGLGLGIALAAAGGLSSLGILAAYLAATLAYTVRIKRVALLDAVTLAGLFTSRLVAGVVFCGVAGSAWLFVLSMFLFTSLALAKRYGEIRQLDTHGAIPGRGYVSQDGPVVLAFGTATAAAAVLMVSLYIVEAAARQAFYVSPDFLWLAPVAIFVWLGRVWLLCGRGALDDDPVEFAIKDGPSLALGVTVLAGFCLACLRF